MISEKDEKKLIQHIRKWNNDISFLNYRILYSSIDNDFFYLFTNSHIFHLMKGYEGDGIKVMTAKTPIFTNGHSYENSESHYKNICPCVKTKLRLNDLTSLKFRKSNENIITMFQIDEKYYTNQGRIWIDPSKNSEINLLLGNNLYDYEIVDKKIYIRMLFETKNIGDLKDLYSYLI